MEIKEKDLEKAVGGSGGDNSRTIGKSTFTGHVGKYDAVVGNKYYALKDNADEWIYGVLVKSYEKSKGCYTVRTHVIDAERGYTINEWYNPALKREEISGDSWTLYTTRSESL